MARLCKGVFIGLNAVALLWSLVSIGWGAFAKAHGGNGCQNALQVPMLVTGAVLFIVSLMGLLGTVYNHRLLMYIYMALMVLLILAMIGFTIFAFVASKKPPVSRKVTPGWLQRKFIDTVKWERFRSCLIEARVCNGLKKDIKKWSSLQSGCCKPPLYCKLDRKDTLVWELPKGGPATPDSDCTTYDNSSKKLCYYCKSCKRGVLEYIRRDWLLMAILDAVVIVLLIAVLVFSFCVKKNIDKEASQRNNINFS